MVNCEQNRVKIARSQMKLKSWKMYSQKKKKKTGTSSLLALAFDDATENVRKCSCLRGYNLSL